MKLWNNDDDCRAAGDALLFSLNPDGKAELVNTTITGNGNCLLTANCADQKTCTGNEKVLIQNVLFQGQKITFNPSEDTCFAWYDDESPLPLPVNPFVITYSLITGVRFGNVTPCPGDGNLCDVPPNLVNSDITSFDAHLQAGSPAIDSGNPEGAPTDDLDGNPRRNNPDMGAYEIN
jgi:hypothetical protein